MGNKKKEIKCPLGCAPQKSWCTFTPFTRKEENKRRTEELFLKQPTQVLEICGMVPGHVISSSVLLDSGIHDANDVGIFRKYPKTGGKY